VLNLLVVEDAEGLQLSVRNWSNAQVHFLDLFFSQLLRLRSVPCSEPLVQDCNC
jgi:hypothetical protein